MQGCSQPRGWWFCVDPREVCDGWVGEGMEADSSSSRAPQESALRSVTPHGFPVPSCGLNGVSMLQLLFHQMAGHGPLELRLLEPLAAGVAAGDQVGSSVAGWM